MTDATIRNLVPEDLDRFFDIFEIVAAEGRWIGTEPGFDREARREVALAGLQDGSWVFLVAEVDGVVIGQLALERVVPGLYELGMLLLPEFRGRGIGSALVQRAIEIARDLGAYKITLQVWPHNEPAIRLYERFGFEREGYLRRHWRRRNGEIWDSVVMGLVLD